MAFFGLKYKKLWNDFVCTSVNLLLPTCKLTNVLMELYLYLKEKSPHVQKYSNK